jgi:hypothetical protein
MWWQPSWNSDQNKTHKLWVQSESVLGAVMVEIVWQLDLQLPVQLVVTQNSPP